MKNQSRLAKALEDQAKALENLRRKQEQVAKVGLAKYLDVRFFQY